jgi:AcrR family transcriptional regulator
MAEVTHARREHILTEAAKVFSFHGFKKASIDDIAKRAAVGKGTVYSIAPSKEDLFLLVVEREVRVWHESTAAIIDPSVPVEELLLRVEGAAMEQVQSNPLLRDLFLGETAAMLPKWEQRLSELRRVGQKNLADIMRIGIDQGAWRKELDVELVSGLLQDFWLGAWMLEPSNLTEAAQMSRTAAGLDLIFQGLRVR